MVYWQVGESSFPMRELDVLDDLATFCGSFANVGCSGDRTPLTIT